MWNTFLVCYKMTTTFDLGILLCQCRTTTYTVVLIHHTHVNVEPSENTQVPKICSSSCGHLWGLGHTVWDGSSIFV